MSLQYSLTNDDYLEFNLTAATTVPALVRQSLRVRMIGSVVLPLAVGITLRLVGADALITLVGTLLALAVAWFSWPLVQRASTAAQLKRMAATSGLGRTGATTLAWDETGVTETANASRATVGWERLERVEQTTGHLFLFFGPTEGLIVPKRAGAGVGELARYARQRLAAR